MNWHNYFRYDPDGYLIWTDFDPNRELGKPPRPGKKKIGGRAGGPHNAGYMIVRVKGTSYLTHRVIWEMHNGPIPEGMQIDHINGNRHDSRISNIRLATWSQNMWNSNSTNKFRVKGIYQNGSGFSSKITFNGTGIYLGIFKTKGLAALAYAKASLRYHGEFSKLNTKILP